MDSTGFGKNGGPVFADPIDPLVDADSPRFPVSPVDAAVVDGYIERVNVDWQVVHQDGSVLPVQVGGLHAVGAGVAPVESVAWYRAQWKTLKETSYQVEWMEVKSIVNSLCTKIVTNKI